MVKILHILGMFLLLTHHTLSYRIFNKIKDHDDHHKLDDKVTKLKLIRLLKYVNKLNHEDDLDEYEDENYNYLEQHFKKPRTFRYRSNKNKNNIPIPLHFNYDIIISEPIKRNGNLFNNKNNKIKSSNYYDFDGYDENDNNNLGYDDFEYQKMFKNYIQRNSDHQNQRKGLCKICRSKQPCQHRTNIAKLNKNQHQIPSPLKSSIFDEYTDENDLTKIDFPHHKRKQKGFQLFMLNDDDDLASSMTSEEMRSTRPTKHSDFQQYEIDSDTEDSAFSLRNHKYRRFPDGSKQRRHEPGIKSIYIKISDIDPISRETISPKHVKEVDYSDLESTESEKVVHIPPLKHTTVRKDQDLDKLTTKRHRLPGIPHKTEFSDTEYEKGESTAAAGDEYDELRTSKSYLTASSSPSSLSSNQAEYDDYGSYSSTAGNDYDNFINMNNNKNDIPSYEEDNMELIKKSKKLKNNKCNGPCQPSSNDYDIEMAPMKCSGSTSSCGVGKNMYNMDKGPCGTEKNPCPVEKKPCNIEKEFFSSTEKYPSTNQQSQCTEKCLTSSSFGDDNLNQNFQSDKLQPYSGSHINWNTYSKSPILNDQSFEPYKYDYDEAKQAHKFYSNNNYKSNDKTMSKGEWSSTKRPDGLADDEISYSENDEKLQKPPPTDGSDERFFNHLKQRKGNDETSKSTLSRKFNDYRLIDLSTRPDKRNNNNKKQRSSVNPEDDEDYNNDMFISMEVSSISTENDEKSPNRRNSNEYNYEDENYKEKGTKRRIAKNRRKKHHRREAPTLKIHSKAKEKGTIQTR